MEHRATFALPEWEVQSREEMATWTPVLPDGIALVELTWRPLRGEAWAIVEGAALPTWVRGAPPRHFDSFAALIQYLADRRAAEQRAREHLMHCDRQPHGSSLASDSQQREHAHRSSTVRDLEP